MKKTLLILFMMSVPVLAATGYTPVQYIGKCDPWPNNVPLPNEELKACYVQRYGVEPGSNPARIGYCCELFGVNYDALANWCRASHPNLDCSPTTTEVTDASFVEARGGRFIYDWYVKLSAGGTPEHRVNISLKDQPCGELTLKKMFLNAYDLYVVNVPPCGQTTTPPPTPAPPPAECNYAGCSECSLTLNPVPPEMLSLAQEIPGWGSSWWSQKRKESVRSLATWLATYKPAIQSTGSMPCVLKSLP